MKHPRSILVLAVAISAALGTGVYYMASIKKPPPVPSLGSNPPELLNWDSSYSITTDNGQAYPTNLTFTVLCIGTIPVTITSLTIRDLTGGFSSPTFSLNAITITIPSPNQSSEINGTTIPSTNNSSVNMDTQGSGFYFVHGHSYSFVVTTSKQTQFVFGPITYV